jgi:endonuclease YncB( thermonuclease family)
MGLCFSMNNTNEKTNENKIELKESILNLEDKLKTVSEKEVEYFNFKGKRFKCRYCNIYDGDTFSIIFIFKDEIIKYRCRCLGYDTPEMKPSLKNPNREKEKEVAKLAKARFIELLEKGKDGLIEVECFEFDKYGRILVNVYNGVDNESLNDIMIKEGHGIPYSGGTKEKFDFE